MSDETQLSTMTEQEFLASLRGDFNNNEDFGAGVRASKKVVLLKASKDLVAFTYVLGDETLDNVKVLPVAFLGKYDSRILWMPKAEGEKTSVPACVANLTPGADRAKMEGIWTGGEAEPPYGEATPIEGETFRCSNCKWNRYGSQTDWDSTKTGKGKACREIQNFVVLPMARGKEIAAFSNASTPLYWYRIDDKVLAEYNHPAITMLSLGVGSNPKLAEEIYLLAQNRKLDVKYCVFNMSVKVEGEGEMRYAKVEIKFAGVIQADMKPELDQRSMDMLGWIKQFQTEIQAAAFEQSKPIENAEV